VVLDIYILMCVETAVLQPFLAFCSTEAWFRAVSMVLKMPSLDIKQHEKLSVILQKLSKIRYECPIVTVVRGGCGNRLSYQSLLDRNSGLTCGKFFLIYLVAQFLL